MKAARALDGRGRAVLRELYLLRDQRARDLNRPAFKVLSDLFSRRRRGDSPERGGAAARSRTSPMTLRRWRPAPGGGAEGIDAEPPERRGGRSQRTEMAPRRAGCALAEIEERYERLRAWRAPAPRSARWRCR